MTLVFKISIPFSPFLSTEDILPTDVINQHSVWDMVSDQGYFVDSEIDDNLLILYIDIDNLNYDSFESALKDINKNEKDFFTNTFNLNDLKVNDKFTLDLDNINIELEGMIK